MLKLLLSKNSKFFYTPFFCLQEFNIVFVYTRSEIKLVSVFIFAEL